MYNIDHLTFQPHSKNFCIKPKGFPWIFDPHHGLLHDEVFAGNVWFDTELLIVCTRDLI